MGTRSTLSVQDQHDHFDIYRHYDGYPNGPDGVIHDIHRAMDRAWPSPRFEAGDFAAAIVSQMKTRPGAVYLTNSAEQHSDRSFHYEVTFKENAIHVAVHRYSERVDALLLAFDGTIDDAVTKYGADRDYNGNPLNDQPSVNIPHDGVDLITLALDAAALDINQASDWSPDIDSQNVLDQIRMAKGLFASDATSDV